MKATNHLVHFLEKELAISGKAISLALRHCEQTPNFLAMTLWQYGLITLDQLAQIFDWLEETGEWGLGAGEIRGISNDQRPTTNDQRPMTILTLRIDNIYDN
ncbi:MAG: DUF2949 domain-containing protein [Desmonostoc geniculatum HA4340-LM1]|nr:DUF2949 domain-containing protein [Desmonostoc geniculatum HA4340-LM1]